MKSIFLLLDKILRRYTPDPFVIAILLSVVTIVLAWALPPESAAEQTSGQRFSFVVESWGDGFWDLAKFTLQMSMILLGGFVVATSPPVKWLLVKMIGLLNSPVQAVLFCTLSAIAASWVNWGFGLVVGGVVALEVGKRLPKVPFRLLVASSYSGFLVWHAGLSGSIPLLLNTEDNFSAEWVGGVMPLSETIFSPLNLVALAALVLLLPGINLIQLSLLGEEETHLVEKPEPPIVDESDVAWIERGPVAMIALVGLGFLYLWLRMSANKFSLNLDSVNFVFFMFGMLLHGSPHAFMKSVTAAVPKIAPILVQYPLYAAIMAVLVKTGLAEQMAQFFVSVANEDTFPLMSFYSAGLINLFVPSGGGQWAVQAPIVIPAAQELGADIPKTVMAVAWGDAWTNMAQPFWAVPLLTIAGLKIKDIIGFCLVTLFASGLVLSLIFLLF